MEGIKEKLRAANSSNDILLTHICDFYSKERSNDKALLETLKELHNSGEINLVEAVSRVNIDSSSYDFFIILQAFEDVLPTLEASVKDVLPCLAKITHQAGRDLAVGSVYETYKRFCRKKADRPIDSVRFILSQSKLIAYAPFLSCSILAFNLEHLDEAIHITASLLAYEDELVRRQAYVTLAKLDVSHLQTETVWDLLLKSANVEEEGAGRALILRAILNFGNSFPSYWPNVEELLLSFTEKASHEVIYEISDIVAFQRVDLPERVLELLVGNMANVSPEDNGTVHNIDYILVKFIEKGSTLAAIKLLESVLLQGVKITDLSYFSHELLKHRELLNHISTKWLLTGDQSLCHSISNLFLKVSGSDIELEADNELLNNDVKKVFVIRKATGWLFLRPISAASFIISMYDKASIDARRELEQVLYDPLLLSYPGELKRFFERYLDQGVQVQLCEHLLYRLKAYHADIEKVSELKELMAPCENINAYRKDSNKHMQAAYEKASKDSIIDVIATKQTLLYGNSSIYYVHHGDGRQVRQETKMHTFSHSTELPRLNVVDPESLDYRLRVYRHERIKDEVDS